MQFRTIAVIALASSFIALSPASAQSAPPSDSVLSGLEACRAETQPEARLACYDRETASLLAANDAGEVRVMNQEDLRTTRRGLFGFSLPRVGLFGSDDDSRGELAKLESTITGVRAGGRNEWLLTIEEGSVWAVRNPSRRFRPKVGDTVELERAALGSYWVRVNGQLGEKGRRVR